MIQPSHTQETAQDGRWNIQKLFSSDKDWQNQCQALMAQGSAGWDEITAEKDFFEKASDEEIASFLDRYYAKMLEVEKLSIYASMRRDEDLRDSTGQKLYAQTAMVAQSFSMHTSWINPAFIALPKERFEALAHSKRLSRYAQTFAALERVRNHTLSAKEEALFAHQERVGSQFQKTYQAVSFADATFEPAKTALGELKPVTHGNYIDLIFSEDRTLRQTAFESMHAFYKSHRHLFGELLMGSNYQYEFEGRSRGFNSPLEAAIDSKAISPKVVESLLSVVEEGFSLLHSYVSLRKEQLGLKKLAPYDFMAPIKDATPSKKISFTEGCELLLAAVAPLGAEYVERLRQGLLEERWVDFEDRQGKRGGAYSIPCFGGYPYILMSWQGSSSSLFTLAHEAGHSMHSELSGKHQEYHLSHYTIFVAEIASTLNELLLFQYLLDHPEKSPWSKQTLLLDMLDRIRATFFRQALFADVEKKMHDLVWADQPLTSETLTTLYKERTKLYHGPDFDGGEFLEYELFRIPHFYTPFYVYQYATGVSAAIAFKAQIEANGAANYLQFLSAGGSRFPTQLLLDSGIDMESRETYLKTLAFFEALLHRVMSGNKEKS